MIPESRGIRKKYFKKLKKISKKIYFFQKKTLAERHVTLFGSRRTVMNWTSPDLYINPEKKNCEKKLKNDRKKWFFFFLQLLSAPNLGKMPNPCRTACYRWNIVPNRIYSWSPSQGASEKNILKNKRILAKKIFPPNNSCRTACYPVQIASNRHELYVLRSLHQLWRIFFWKNVKNDQQNYQPELVC